MRLIGVDKWLTRETSYQLWKRVDSEVVHRSLSNRMIYMSVTTRNSKMIIFCTRKNAQRREDCKCMNVVVCEAGLA